MKHTPNADAVATTLLTDPTSLARAVTEALAAAGAQTDWDAETIESVLQPIASYAEHVGLPTATNAAAPGSLKHWRAVADELDIYHDGTDEDEDDEEDDTVGPDDSEDDVRTVGGAL